MPVCVRFQTASGGTEEAELSEKSTGRSVRAYLGLPEHAGVLRRAGTSAPLPDQLGDLDEGTYELEVHPQLLAGVDKHVNPTAMATAEAVAAGIRRRRTLAMIGSLYVLTWATHVFLPHWANTPYLFTTGTALVNLWIENVWLTPTVDMDVAGAIYALMACVVAHAALADAGCVLEYHIVIFCIWLGLRRLGSLHLWTPLCILGVGALLYFDAREDCQIRPTLVENTNRMIVSFRRLVLDLPTMPAPPIASPEE